MSEIITVMGPVGTGSLKAVQCHEHLAISKGKSYEINPALCIDDAEKSAEEAARFREAGGQTLIDAQPVGCNRVVSILQSASEKAGINIICSTGFHKMAFYPEKHWIHSVTENEFYGILRTELLQGTYSDEMADSLCSAEDLTAAGPDDRNGLQTKAGIIKIAYDREELSPRYRTLFEATARCAAETDCCVMIHVEGGTDPRRLQKFFTERGINPQRLMFCHMDRACADLEKHFGIAEEGSYLEYDTIGRFKYHSDEEEIGIFREMIRRGYLNKLLYSLDTTRERLKSYNPDGIGLDYILKIFNRKMMDSGISAEELNAISVLNPATYLSRI